MAGRLVAIWLGLMAVGTVAGCGDDPLSVSLGGAVPSAGYAEHSVTLSDGSTMRFTSWMSFVPRQSRPPLVVALHGGGQVYPFVGGAFLRALPKPALEDLGAIFVAPDAPSGSWTHPRSQQAVIALIDKLVERWPVDGDRVILTGYSNGGLGVWVLTAEYGDRIMAGLPVASDVLASTAGGTDRVPMFLVHGTADEVFDYEEVRQAVEDLQEGGADVELRTADGVGHASRAAFVGPLSEAIPWLESRYPPGR